jgi:pimeloyl-ACP methyl ester carboxylesterase
VADGVVGPGDWTSRAEPGGPREATPLPDLDGVRHLAVDLPGLRMHVAEAGSGEPVLLLHGFPQHWWEWRRVVPRLAEHHRVVVPDLRGAGWTEAPDAGYDRRQLVADVVALLDALHLEAAHVVGHDWGALLGYQLSLRRPDRVRSMLSLSVPHPYVRASPRTLLRAWRAWYQAVIAAPVIGPRALSGGGQRFPRHLLLGYTTDRSAFTDQDVELFLAPLRDPAVARAGTQLYRHFIQPEAVRILSGSYRHQPLAVPTVALVGTADPLVDVDTLRPPPREARDLTVAAVDGASHWVVDERPEVVADHTLALAARS